MVLLLSVAFAATLSTTSPEWQAVHEVASTAQARDKQIERQLRTIEKEERKRSIHRNKIYRRHRAEADSIGRELDALAQLRYYLSKERETIRRIAAIDEAGKMERMYTEAALRIDELDFAAKHLSTKESEAKQRYAAASQDNGVDRGLLASTAREVAAWQDTRAAFERERAMYEQLLVAMGTGTLDEVRTRSANAQERINERTYRRYASGGGSGGDSFGALVIAIGLVAAVAAVLSDPASTTEEKAEAKRKLESARADARSRCIAGGGHFFEGGGENIGYCAP